MSELTSLPDGSAVHPKWPLMKCSSTSHLKHTSKVRSFLRCFLKINFPERIMEYIHLNSNLSVLELQNSSMDSFPNFTVIFHPPAILYYLPKNDGSLGIHTNFSNPYVFQTSVSASVIWQLLLFHLSWILSLFYWSLSRGLVDAGPITGPRGELRKLSRRRRKLLMPPWS